MAASRAGRAVLVHDVGELVVAVHEAGDVVDRLVGPQPGRGLVEAGQLPALDPLEEGGPAVDLALVEAVGPAEVLQALGLPVDLRQQGDALDQLVGQARRGPRGRRRRAPARAGSRRASSRGPSATSRRRSPSGRRPGPAPSVSVHAAMAGVWGTSVPVERLDDAPLPQMPVVPALRRGRRRDAQRAVEVAPADLVDLVLGAARHEAALDRLARRPGPGRPASAPRRVDGRSQVARPRARGTRPASPGPRPPSSGGARWARGRRSGRWSRRTWRATVTLWTSVGPSARPMTLAAEQHPGERHLVADAEGAVDLHGPPGDVVEHGRHDHLDGGDVLAHPLVVVVLVDLPRRVEHEQPELLELGVGVGDVALHELLVGQQASPASPG